MPNEIVVLANGVFDLFHYGHLLHLRAARKFGDRLVVSVTNDAHVNKGPGRPTFPVLHRAEILRAMTEIVDEVICVDSLMEALIKVRPRVLVKGRDYVGRMDPIHEAYCAEHGIAIRMTDEPIISATQIIHDRLRDRQ